MPELPEVETVRRGLARVFDGSRLVRVETRRPDLRFPFPDRFVERLEGQRVAALGRRAKYLLSPLDSGETLVMHMGMSGSFRIEETPSNLADLPLLPLAGEGGAQRRMRGGREQELISPVLAEAAGRALQPTPHPPFGDLLPPSDLQSKSRGEKALETPGLFLYPRTKASAHDHVIFHFASGARVIYNDPRRFGFMTIVETNKLDAHPLFEGLGVEPLSEAFSPTHLIELLAGVRAPLKSALLDQRRIAGLGNIYVCEALYRARLSPLKAAGEASRAKLKALHRAIRDVLGEAIEAGGSTLRDHRQADGALGYFQHTFAVYDREGTACLRKGCSGTISRVAQTGRSTFYCAVCQV